MSDHNKPPTHKLGRRSLLKALPIAAMGAMLGGRTAATAAEAKSVTSAAPTEKPVLTVAHLTDIHYGADLIDSSLSAGLSRRGLTETLRQVQSHQPDFILQGGDLIAEAFNLPREKVAPQFEGVKEILAAEVKVPIYHAIGNHDIWGWDKESSGTTGKEDGWGKAWYMREVGLKEPYYSFDVSGWHFIVLDDIRTDDERAYSVGIDSDQLKWLKDDVKDNADKPTVLLSHAPILSVGAFYDGSHTSGDWVVPRDVMNIDTPRLRLIFRKNPQIKLALSGHTHLHDQALYDGLLFANGGCVSGNGWYGNKAENKPGFNLVRLWADGRVAVEYKETGIEVGQG